MKKIFLSVILASTWLITGCVNDSEDFNDDRDKPYELPPVLQVNHAEKELAKQIATPDVNLNVFRYFQHYWTSTTYYTDAIFDFTGTRKVPDNHWNVLYRNVLGNLESAKGSVLSEVKPATITQENWDKQQNNKLAIIDILQVYVFNILVDSFGDVPYSEALNPKLALPKYDDAATIYPNLLQRLDDDLAKLDPSYGSFEAGEHLLRGDTGKWKIFANSLKLKIGINLADVNPSLAKSTIESAYAGGVVLDSSQDIAFDFPSSAPDYNPIYASVIASGRNDYVAEETLVNAMNGLNDPRIAVYYTLYTEKDSSGNITFSGYKGGVLGTANSYSAYSHIGTALLNPDFPAYLFDSSEINFYLSEAAARGYSVGGSAESYYVKAIKESFKQWGLSDADATAYIATVPFSSGSWKESIGEQAWIALFNRGFESWNFWKRLDYPKLTAPNAISWAEGKVPVRLTYPINEQTVNGANYSKAAGAIGGDLLTTKIFWDVN
ncbi:MAG: SusD/RagB family nutrient-binding outer membrane lipoprotein [Flavobacteriaceae bacterium]|jgi:hypothetical protein|nr:SusD/RagB family nutrient-binding outer membrane lipoprotein [Flavobacteriaceae bacterium]